jgi:DNA-directed RNA polymerase III subunit RPC1
MLRIDMDAIARLQLDLNASDVATAIHKTKGLKLTRQNIQVTEPLIRITPNEPDYSDEDDMDLDGVGSDDEEMQKAKGRRKKKFQMHFLVMQDLKRNLEQVVVKGYPNTSRTIISRSDNSNQAGVKTLALLVEGYGLKACMSTEGVNGRQTSTNSVMETCDVLGIEAARSVIISEIQTVMESMDIDNHHIHLLACIMTLKGEVLGITRFGMAKMRDSVLQLASFEKTPDHLFEAATKMKSDPISGVSESIIMGQSVKLGTGAAGVIRPLYIKNTDLALKEPLFHTSYHHGRIGTGWESFGWSMDTRVADAV